MANRIEPVLVLAFHNDIEGKSKGTKDMVSVARSRGITVKIVTSTMEKEKKAMIIKSKYAGWCNRCNKAFPVGADIDWDKERAEKTLCMDCSKAGPGAPDAPLPGVKLNADEEELGF